MLITAIAIALTAGLGAAATVTGPTANGSGQVALTGITHTQRAMGENLDLNGRIGADIADLFLAQLPA